MFCTHRQTDRQTDTRRTIKNMLGESNNSIYTILNNNMRAVEK